MMNKREVLLEILSKNERLTVREVGALIAVEANVHKVVTPARTYTIGWGLRIEAAPQELSCKETYGWNEPAYGKPTGQESWADQPHQKLKKSKWVGTASRALEKIRQSCEKEIVLPNGLLARWCIWENEMVGWAEVPKANRKELQAWTWNEFLDEQKIQFGDGAVKEWQKKLLLVRDPHPTIVRRFETEDTAAYRKARHEKILALRKENENY
jgi:hypothetical protein